MKQLLLAILLLNVIVTRAQVPVDLTQFNKTNGADVQVKANLLSVQWPAGGNSKARLLLNMGNEAPLFQSIALNNGNGWKETGSNIDPMFVLTVGKRDLVSQNGWNIFFDKVPLKPHASYRTELHKTTAAAVSEGAHTIIRIGAVTAPGFSGTLEITLYHGSPLFNVAAVISTATDSTAILYDAGLVGTTPAWQHIAWSNTGDSLQKADVHASDTSTNLAVKYRTIIGETTEGSLAVFPAPHQYFYPLDEAFNLRFTWYGTQYRNLLNGYGIGIRQELEGDHRFVPWFNAPPHTAQRLNFFCLASTGTATQLLSAVKAFTHEDRYPSLPGYKTMSSHFHNEFVTRVVMAGKPVPAVPGFVKVFKRTGIDIVHLAEFHGTGHPTGPDSLRLQELHHLFEQCQRLSSPGFLLLPGEEPNQFLGGHWLAFFPRPVYWVMSRKPGVPLVSNDAVYGKVYHTGNAADMEQLLQTENGLAWTAHPRTKGSTGFPDAYKNEPFFTGDHFLGGAWKSLPADLSQPRLGKRVFDLMDDMNNWGLHKKILAEADLFTIEPENEMYAHLNVNYLQLKSLPRFTGGWQPVLDVLQKGHFFSTTGEIVLPAFSINHTGAGDTLALPANGKTTVTAHIRWTFPLQFAEIISGDGKQVYRERITLNQTHAFGDQTFQWPVSLAGRKWARLEVWDVAVNGAFTQTVYLR
ncbi:CehA/McbA family metallohydrolase domain-containing protein [Deminuibacter soli]|uniref:Uncharacterized protein n=1 Tax=Deminuibacter soli TaxID=2291815 RepID=A0A3E1NK34_9BACT|nr:hypothetical protein [Deminuibacter soli]RFM28299.1 hypothetical protein DXN05_12365 [Deminuibacter soli]